MRYLIYGLFFASAACCHTAFAAEDDGDDYFTQRISKGDIPANAPSFADHPAKENFKGKPAPAQINQNPLSKMFRTAIRQGATEGPNFAGHFTLVSWGCGTACASYAIVDARTGKVFHPPALQSLAFDNIAVEELPKEYQDLVSFRRDSRLLIVVGGIQGAKMRGIGYFVWNGQVLKLIKKVAKPSHR